MGSSRVRMAVCTGSAGARRAGGWAGVRLVARARAGLIGATCWVTSNGVLCCATRGGNDSCAAVWRARRALMPRCCWAAWALALALALVSAAVDASLRKICTTTLCIACCRGQYKLAIHSKATCTKNTSAHTSRRLRAGGRSVVGNSGRVTMKWSHTPYNLGFSRTLSH